MGGEGLDYLRDDLFPLVKMDQIPPDGPGITLSNLLDAQVNRAIASADAVVIAFGNFFSNPGQADPNFEFSPGKGIHDIHMMQGDTGRFAEDNRINGDGALFIQFSSDEAMALFVRFSTQETATDDSGNATQIRATV